MKSGVLLEISSVRHYSTIGGGCIGAPLVLADYKEDDRVRCASPISMLIAHYFGFTNRKRKCFEEKKTATLKSKQTSIATVRNHLRTLASFPNPPHFSLVTNFKRTIFCFLSSLPKSFSPVHFLLSMDVISK